MCCLPCCGPLGAAPPKLRCLAYLFVVAAVLLDFILQFPVTYKNFAYFHHNVVHDNVDTLYRKPNVVQTAGEDGTGASSASSQQTFWSSMKKFFTDKANLVSEKLKYLTGNRVSLLKAKKNDSAKITVLINQFQRPSCLRKQLRVLRRCSIVHSIYVNWFDLKNPVPSSVQDFIRGSEDSDEFTSSSGGTSGTTSTKGEGEFVEELETEPEYRIFPPSRLLSEEEQNNSKIDRRMNYYEEQDGTTAADMADKEVKAKTPKVVVEDFYAEKRMTSSSRAKKNKKRGQKAASSDINQKKNPEKGASKKAPYRLTEKFRPHLFPTDAVFVTDVDMFYSCHALQFAYNVWSQYNENEVEDIGNVRAARTRMLEAAAPSTAATASPPTAAPTGVPPPAAASVAAAPSEIKPVAAAPVPDVAKAIAAQTAAVNAVAQATKAVVKQNLDALAAAKNTANMDQVKIQAVHRDPHPTISQFVKAVGFHPRYLSRTASYDWSLSYRHSQKFLHNTIFVTKGALIHKDLFSDFFKPEYESLRQLVDREFAGADLLMSYVLAMEYGPHAFRALCPKENYHLATAESCSANRRPSNVFAPVPTGVEDTIDYAYDAEADMLLEYNSVGLRKAKLSWRLAFEKRRMIKRIFGTQKRNYLNKNVRQLEVGAPNAEIIGALHSSPPSSFKAEAGRSTAASRSSPEGREIKKENTRGRVAELLGLHDFSVQKELPQASKIKAQSTTTPDETQESREDENYPRSLSPAGFASTAGSAVAHAASRVPSHDSVDSVLARAFQGPPGAYTRSKDEEGFALKSKVSEFQTYYANSVIWERQTRFYMDFWRWIDRQLFGMWNQLDCPSAPWRSISAEQFWFMQKVH
ncbi:unnamed protein product [Amoebophrya sp. A120]|nr:unnamed protein product [Amoebophrya sp. A120]|eukprot:GSA120T00019982001.1